MGFKLFCLFDEFWINCCCVWFCVVFVVELVWWVFNDDVELYVGFEYVFDLSFDVGVVDEGVGVGFEVIVVFVIRFVCCVVCIFFICLGVFGVFELDVVLVVIEGFCDWMRISGGFWVVYVLVCEKVGESGDFDIENLLS